MHAMNGTDERKLKIMLNRSMIMNTDLVGRDVDNKLRIHGKHLPSIKGKSKT